MIGHVFSNVQKSKAVTSTFVATCDLEIHDYIISIGGKSVITSNKHERASDRCAHHPVRRRVQRPRRHHQFKAAAEAELHASGHHSRVGNP